MSILKPNHPYRIGVRFDPPLSTLRQLRQLSVIANGKHTVLSGLSLYKAQITAVYPPGSDYAKVDYGVVLFTVTSAGKAPISRAVVETIRPEVNLKP
jgi:hypothetical protein